MSFVSVGAAAWVLYDRASQIHLLGSWISYLLPGQDPRIRELLQALGRRVDALSQPLNYCLLWVHDKGSCVADVVFQARDLLNRVEQFIHDCADKQRQNEKLLHDEMLNTLSAYLRELDFAMTSISLAINLINSTGALAPGSGGAAGAGGGGAAAPALSPSAILRASQRICDLHDSGGDLTMTLGTLYSFEEGRREEEEEEENDDEEVEDDGRDEEVEDERVGAPVPSPVSLASALAAVHQSRSRHTSTNESSDGDSWERVDEESQYETVAPPSPPHSADPRNAPVGRLARGWRVELRHAALKVHHHPTRRAFELHIQDDTPLDSLQAPASAGSYSFPLLPSLRFSFGCLRAQGMLESTEVLASGVSPLDPAFSWVEMLAGQVQRKYVFVLSNPTLTAAATETVAAAVGSDSVLPGAVLAALKSSQHRSAMRPIDIDYLVKLCTYENLCQSSQSATRTTSNADPDPYDDLAAPAHTRASDEELWLLLSTHT